MKELRKLGFSNHDIRILIDGRWSQPTIKRFTRGIKVMNTTERDEILYTFATATIQGITPQNVSEYLTIKENLESHNINLEMIIDFHDKLREFNISFNELLEFQQKLHKTNYSVEELSENIENFSKLIELGLSGKEIEFILILSQRFGDVKSLIEGMMIYATIDELKDIQKQNEENNKQMEQVFDELNSQINNLRAVSTTYTTYIDVAKTLITQYKFDPISLKALMDVVTTFGEPFQILDALATYKNIKELNQKKLELNSEIQLLDESKEKKQANKKTLDGHIEEANMKIGEIKANYESNLVLQNINSILTNPKETEIDPKEFLKISLNLLIGLNQYAAQNQTTFPSWEKDIKSLINFAIKNLTDTL